MILISAPLSTAVLGETSGCDKASAVIGGCPNVNGGIRGDEAVLDGDLTVDGSPASGGPRVSGPGSAGGSAAPPRPCEEVFAGYCYGEGSPKPGEQAEGIPTVTLSDIAVFRPQAAVQFMQPDGWMVVGLPTNFVAVIDRHIVPGTLLGSAAEVRFTPVAYRCG